MAPGHLCAGGCGQLLPRDVSRCRRCRLAQQQTRDSRRGTPPERGYHKAHHAWRRIVLSLHPTCPCGAPSTVADHIVPLSRGGAPFDFANGQGLCASCHNAKTMRERAQLLRERVSST